MKDITLRKETQDDFGQVAKVIEMAFCQKNEALLVEKLKHNSQYSPQLSIVVDYKGSVVGHILFSPAVIRSESSGTESLVMAPLSVLPEFQKMSIGGRLIHECMKIAREAGFNYEYSLRSHVKVLS